MLFKHKLLYSLLRYHTIEIDDIIDTDYKYIYEFCIKHNNLHNTRIIYDFIHELSVFKDIDHKSCWLLALKNGSYELINYLKSKPEYNTYSVDYNICNPTAAKLLLRDEDITTNTNYYFKFAQKYDFDLMVDIYNKYHNTIKLDCSELMNNICYNHGVNEYLWAITTITSIESIQNNFNWFVKSFYACNIKLIDYLTDKYNFKPDNGMISCCIRLILDNNKNISLIDRLLAYDIKLDNQIIILACKLGIVNILEKAGKLSNPNELLRIAISSGQLSVIKYIINLYSDNITYDLQIDYDCRINKETADYVSTYFGFTLKRINSNECMPVIYNNYKYYHTNLLPDDNSKFWSTLPYIIIEIPKNATCSIVNSIGRVNCFGHALAKSFPTHIRHKLKAICRNPYDRAVSAYFFAKRGGFSDNWEYNEIAIKYPTFEQWVLYGLTKEMTKMKYYEGWMEPFIRQSEFVVDNSKNIIIDHDNIGRFENLKDDCKKLFGITLTAHDNQTVHDYWSTYYTNPLVKDKIYRLYKKDFELFGYDKSF